MTVSAKRTHPLWFLLPFLAIYAAVFLVLDKLPSSTAPSLLATGLTLDLMVLVPLLYYLVFIRGRGLPAVTIGPVMIASYLAATFIVPKNYQDTLDLLALAIPLVELGLVGFIGYKIFRIVRAGRAASRREGDFYDQLRETLKQAIDIPTAVNLVASEVAILYYVFSRNKESTEKNHLTYHKHSGYTAVFAALLIAGLTELVAIHFLLQSWSETAALIHLFVSGYAILWVIGDYRAMKRRPHILNEHGLQLRLGLRWEIAVRHDQIASIERNRNPKEGTDYLSLVSIGSPTYVIRLIEPIVAHGLYGMRRTVERIGIGVDDQEVFDLFIDRSAATPSLTRSQRNTRSA